MTPCDHLVGEWGHKKDLQLSQEAGPTSRTGMFVQQVIEADHLCYLLSEVQVTRRASDPRVVELGGSHREVLLGIWEAWAL